MTGKIDETRQAGGRDFRLTDDPHAADPAAIHALLQDTYWGGRRPRAIVDRMLAHSLCFTLLEADPAGGPPRIVGFGRAVSDCATATWISDIVVTPSHRGLGLGRWLLEAITSHPDLVGTQMVLRTRDATRLYEAFGFHRHEGLMTTGTPTG